jgi:hypothetical protein
MIKPIFAFLQIYINIYTVDFITVLRIDHKNELNPIDSHPSSIVNRCTVAIPVAFVGSFIQTLHRGPSYLRYDGL